eukprot:GHVO01050233.1.p1 GENE.GHVO01050233.1~~GHVO01050233.1.p1  ORF type:complete len:177 (-),score=21.28 GHVO01050233.1:60-590(-)
MIDLYHINRCKCKNIRIYRSLTLAMLPKLCVCTSNDMESFKIYANSHEWTQTLRMLEYNTECARIDNVFEMKDGSLMMGRSMEELCLRGYAVNILPKLQVTGCIDSVELIAGGDDVLRMLSIEDRSIAIGGLRCLKTSSRRCEHIIQVEIRHFGNTRGGRYALHVLRKLRIGAFCS